MITAAMYTAKFAHKGQARKYTGEPYIVHPFAVAGLISSVSNRPSLVAAALLHDVVEDTAVTLDTINGLYGEEVRDLVSDLTNISKPEHGNRATRFAIDKAHTAAASPDAKSIKLADIIDNTKTVALYDPNFAKVYMQERSELLEVLREGNPTLWGLAHIILENYFINN